MNHENEAKKFSQKLKRLAHVGVQSRLKRFKLLRKERFSRFRRNEAAQIRIHDTQGGTR